MHANETQIFATMLSDPVKALKKKKKNPRTEFIFIISGFQTGFKKKKESIMGMYHGSRVLINPILGFND